MDSLGDLLRWLVPESGEDDLSNHLHRQIVGCVGLLLPFALWLLAGIRPIETMKDSPWELLKSISAYHYTSALPALSGSLGAISVFFFAYRGYKNKYQLRDRIAGIVAGIAAFLVVVFPGRTPEGVDPPWWWSKDIRTVHLVSAIVLFCCFAFFGVFQFSKSRSENVKLLKHLLSGPGEWGLGKWVRNWIYVLCAVGIVACLIWTVIAFRLESSVFWPEALALEFFAVSWLVKGRANKTVGRAWLALRGKRPPETAAS